MARYIDADKIDYTVTMVGRDEYAGYRAVAFESDIEAMPTADVAPRAEFDRVARELERVEALYFAKDTQLENAKAEVAREIFEEIDRMCVDTFGNFNYRVFAELKKKYTEEQK